MVETVVSIGLPVDENMIIQKNRLQPDILHGDEKRFLVVTGTHGDELEGQYVCYELIRRINEHRECLKGIVDVYPDINPLGINSINRGVPMFDLDLNRIFPGSPEGHMAECAAHQLIEDMKGADGAVDIHASNIFLREIPQVRMSVETSARLLPIAKKINVDYIWVHSSATVLQSTLAHTLNSMGVPTLVVEMGVGMRLTRDYCEQLIDGLFNVLIDMGIWEGEPVAVKEPIISTDGQVSFVNADASGVFVPCIEHWRSIGRGQKLGEIVNPLTGEVCEELFSEVDGMVFTLREYPIVVEGALIARILGGVAVDEKKTADRMSIAQV